MSLKITAFVITFLIALGTSVAILFFLLIAMNGYSESDAAWGFGVYGVAAFASVLLMSAAAFFLTGALVKKQMNAVLSVVASVAACSVGAVVLQIIGSLACVGVAEWVRVNY